MPLRAKATPTPSAPADRIYKTPIPKEQKKFPERRKRVTYGKSTGPRIPKPDVQTTLTQMYWVDDTEEGQGTEVLDYVEEEEAKRKQKRRRTMGDEHNEIRAVRNRRRAEAAGPASSSIFHTQTLTQWDRSFSAADEEESDMFKEDLEAALEATSPTAIHNEQEGIPKRGVQSQRSIQAGPSKYRGDIYAPKTPKSGRTFEIPSTQSPASPDDADHPFEQPQSPLSNKTTKVSVKTGRNGNSVKGKVKGKPERSIKFSGLGKPQAKRHVSPPKCPTPSHTQRRALLEKSTNFSSMPNKSTEKAPKLKIEDTFETDLETQLSRIPSSPPKLSSPMRSNRFQTADAYIDGSTNNNYGPAAQLPKSTPAAQPSTPRTIFKTEISDSEDDESDLEMESELEETQIEDNYDEAVAPEQFSGVRLVRHDKISNNLLDDPPSTVLASGSNSDIHDEADKLAQSQIKEEVLESQEDMDVSLKVEGIPEVEAKIPIQQPPEKCYDDFGMATQINLHNVDSSLLLSSEEPVPQSEMEDPTLQTQRTTQFSRTQGMESQRLSTQHVDAMAPRFYGSDVFISMHSQQVTEIMMRKRDHHFTPHALHPKTSRIWLYETAPVCLLKYMAVISSALCPGELRDERGIGNLEFNSGKSNVSKYAYEILEVYELADPLSLARLRNYEWLDKAPKNELVRPAVIDHLMANLKPPLFTNVQKELAEVSSSSTDTQEIEAQLISESTQFHQSQVQRSSSPIGATEYATELTTTFVPLHDSSPIPSSSPLQLPQMASIRNVTRSSYRNLPSSKPLTRPSQATTVDLTQTQNTPARPESRNSDVEIVFESPVRKYGPSSTPLSHFEGEGNSNVGFDTTVPYSMASSQLLTKSQLLPESLLTESVPPPRFVYDSQDDEDLYDNDDDYDDI
ncbi:hypothetical protein BP5796_03965 [Coleophoma crateriformis]|uniref:Uncharacterized protein n=1 Tax=Coleophoma crateriformis TaxID=565419 RepID=A0A3D8SH37_9HELO|nr:hypothetical protein BP5796_03965 [Coleophoma crateriformis]